MTVPFSLERFAPAIESARPVSKNGSITGRCVPYNVSDNRSGLGWIAEPGQEWPTAVPYEYSVFLPGAFRDWLAGNSSRIRFLFQHGDAGESWTGNPIGLMSLPLGSVTRIVEKPDGLYFSADFAQHPIAQWVRQLAEASALSDLSISQVPVKVSYQRDSAGRTYRAVETGELWDISIVVWGQFADNAVIAEAYSRAGIARYAHWTTAYVNDLPDSAFAVIKPGGEKDDEGKTTPRDLRMLPHHDDTGAVDPDHVRNGLSRAAQPDTDLTDSERAEAKAHLQKHLDAINADEKSHREARQADGSINALACAMGDHMDSLLAALADEPDVTAARAIAVSLDGIVDAMCDALGIPETDEQEGGDTPGAEDDDMTTTSGGGYTIPAQAGRPVAASVQSRIRERRIGAAISTENAAKLSAAATDLRSMAETCNAHAGTLEGLAALSGGTRDDVPTSEPDAATADADALARARHQAAREREMALTEL